MNLFFFYCCCHFLSVRSGSSLSTDPLSRQGFRAPSPHPDPRFRGEDAKTARVLCRISRRGVSNCVFPWFFYRCQGLWFPFLILACDVLIHVVFCSSHSPTIPWAKVILQSPTTSSTAPPLYGKSWPKSCLAGLDVLCIQHSSNVILGATSNTLSTFTSSSCPSSWRWRSLELDHS